MEKANIFKLLRRYLFSNEKIKIYEKKGFKHEYEWRKNKYPSVKTDIADGIGDLFGILFFLLFIYCLLTTPSLFFIKTNGKIISISATELSYEYVVNNEKYLSDKIFMFQDLVPSKTIADIKIEKIKNLKLNNEISVFYNPILKNYSLLNIGILTTLFFLSIIFWLTKMMASYMNSGVVYYRFISWMIIVTLVYLITVIRMGGI